MAADPDDMWKPGYVGPVIGPLPGRRAEREQRPHVETRERRVESPIVDPGVSPVDFDAVGDREPSGRGKRWRRRVALALVVAGVVVAGAMFAAGRGRSDDDRPDVAAVAGADPRRMPVSVEPLWSTTLDERRLDIGLRELVVHEGAVLSILDDEGDGSVVVALDPADGSVRWRRRFDFAPTSARVLGTFDEVMVLERNDVIDRRLLALDVTDGSIRWELPTTDNGVHVALDGSAVITRVSFTGNERLTFVDPATGDEVARVEGRLIGTDLSGTWYVVNDSRVVEIDLSDGWSEPVELVVARARFDDAIGVVDRRVIVMDDGVLSEFSPDGGTMQPFLVRPFGNDIAAGSIIGAGGPMFVAVGGGRVVGATLGRGEGSDVVTIVWSRDGSLRDAVVSSRGVVISMFDERVGPAGRLVIDAVTGDVIIEALGPLTDDEQPIVVGDGVVVTNTELGQERVGYDLDGTELWRLAAPGTVRLGDRVLVTLDDTPEGYRISAFG